MTNREFKLHIQKIINKSKPKKMSYQRLSQIYITNDNKSCLWAISQITGTTPDEEGDKLLKWAIEQRYPDIHKVLERFRLQLIEAVSQGKTPLSSGPRASNATALSASGDAPAQTNLSGEEAGRSPATRKDSRLKTGRKIDVPSSPSQTDGDPEEYGDGSP
jgi:hypothetical protein